jgi:murein DD-endopeptidase MepM/ murein hydrolase activator NlpD
MLAFALLAAATGSAGHNSAAGHELEQKRSAIASAQARQRELGAAIAAQSETIDGLQADVAALHGQVLSLEHELAVARRRLMELQRELDEERATLRRVRRELGTAQRFLGRRLVEIYESDPPTTVEVVLGARNLDDVLEQLDVQERSVGADQRLIRVVNETRRAMTAAARRTTRLRDEQREKTVVIGARTVARRQAYEALVAKRNRMVELQEERRRALAAVQVHEKTWTAEAAALEADAQRITQAAEAPTLTPANPVPVASSGGLIWPVRGSLVSPFGMRGGRLHAGIDIAAPAGTPIAASASGSVTYAGSMSGYGLIVVVQHANGIATAYAHNSSISVSVGEQVSQGQTIAAVGCTGHCFGDHVHFEVRVGGSPVDPMAYL